MGGINPAGTALKLVLNGCALQHFNGCKLVVVDFKRLILTKNSRNAGPDQDKDKKQFFH